MPGAAGSNRKPEATQRHEAPTGFHSAESSISRAITFAACVSIVPRRFLDRAAIESEHPGLGLGQYRSPICHIRFWFYTATAGHSKAPLHKSGSAPTTDRKTDTRPATVIGQAHPMREASRAPPLQATSSWDTSSAAEPPVIIVPSDCGTFRVPASAERLACRARTAILAVSRMSL